MRKIIAGLGLCAALVSCTVTAFANEGISISNVWARPVILEGRPGAAYLTIENGGDQADELIKVTSPKAERIELHVHRHENGVMKMEEVSAIPVAAQGTTEITPGGYHLMLFGLTEKLAIGGALPLVLTFSHAGEITVTADIRTKAPEAVK